MDPINIHRWHAHNRIQKSVMVSKHIVLRSLHHKESPLSLLSWRRESSSLPMFNPELVANKVPCTRNIQTSYLFCCATGSMVPVVILGLTHG
jgi:hypothetical protein